MCTSQSPQCLSDVTSQYCEKVQSNREHASFQHMTEIEINDKSRYQKVNRSSFKPGKGCTPISAEEDEASWESEGQFYSSTLSIMHTSISKKNYMNTHTSNLKAVNPHAVSLGISGM